MKEKVNAWEFLMILGLVIMCEVWGLGPSLAAIGNSAINFSIPVINATNAEVVPSVTYPQYWISQFLISSPSPTSQASLTAVLIPYDGNQQVLKTQRILVKIPNLFNAANNNTNLATFIQNIFSAVHTICVTQGKCQ